MRPCAVARSVRRPRLASRIAATGNGAAPPRPPATGDEAAAAYGWDVLTPARRGPNVVDLPLAAIRRPLAGNRGNDDAKIAALALSLAAHGLREPIDVLECDGVYYGFSGCHRFAAATQLGWHQIAARVRKATPATLRMHIA